MAASLGNCGGKVVIGTNIDFCSILKIMDQFDQLIKIPSHRTVKSINLKKLIHCI